MNKQSAFASDAAASLLLSSLWHGQTGSVQDIFGPYDFVEK